MMRRALMVSIVVIFLESPSLAAVRMCKSLIAVGPFTAKTEIDAKKQALDAWKAEALKLGERYAAWGTATDRSLTCKRGDGVSFVCTAAASPCTIEQAPNTLESRSKRMGI